MKSCIRRSKLTSITFPVLFPQLCFNVFKQLVFVKLTGCPLICLCLEHLYLVSHTDTKWIRQNLGPLEEADGLQDGREDLNLETGVNRKFSIRSLSSWNIWVLPMNNLYYPSSFIKMILPHKISWQWLEMSVFHDAQYYVKGGISYINKHRFFKKYNSLWEVKGH